MTNEKLYTPGPWVIEYHDEKTYAGGKRLTVGYNSPTRTQTICDLHAAYKQDANGVVTVHENKLANARLIEQAPALLHMLEHFLARGECAAMTARHKAKYENATANNAWADEQTWWNEQARAIINAAYNGRA